MLIAARGKYGGGIHVTEQLSKNGNDYKTDGNIAALFRESWFNSGGNVEDDGLQDDLYVDFGDDSLEDVDRELEKRVNEAKTYDMSETEIKR